jgi:hypothetical protein
MSSDRQVLAADVPLAALEDNPVDAVLQAAAEQQLALTGTVVPVVLHPDARGSGRLHVQDGVLAGDASPGEASGVWDTMPGLMPGAPLAVVGAAGEPPSPGA